MKKSEQSNNKTFDPIIQSAQKELRIFNNNYASVIQQTLDSTSYIKKCLQEFKNTVNIVDKIADKKTITVLKKYKWFITPSFPLTFAFKIGTLDKKNSPYKALNQLFIRFFEAKNWRNLEIMVSNWQNKPLFKKRYKILKDCVDTLKIARKKRINETNVILPTLLTQIDGLFSDYLKLKGLQQSHRYAVKKSQFKNTIPKVLAIQLYNPANYIFLEILFQESWPGTPLKPSFNFNRHKIIHGESVKYGRKDYLIRAFMILDFLAHL